MPLATEDEILVEALRWFGESPERFTPDVYLEGEDEKHVDVPGRGVARTCAVGGIEQAVWRLTGENVAAGRQEIQVDGGLLYQVKNENVPLPDELDETHRLYARVMGRLNRLVAARFADEEIVDIEDVTTMTHNEDTDREAMIEVIELAHAELAG